MHRIVHSEKGDYDAPIATVRSPLRRSGTRLFAAVLLPLLVAGCASSVPEGGAPTNPMSVTAPIVGSDLAPGDVMAAYDYAVGDTLLALGEVHFGQPRMLELELAPAEAVPKTRYTLPSADWAANCLPGTVQPESLLLAYVSSVERIAGPARYAQLVTATGAPFPDLHVAILADQPGSIRGTCRFQGMYTDRVVTIDLSFNQGWNWFRAAPYEEGDYAGGHTWGVWYTLDAMVPARPGANAFWTDLGSWSPEPQSSPLQ